MGLDTGTRIGTFEIEALIGRGGMGEVYRGVDTRLRRPVAIKLMSGDLRDAAARRRFEREAEIVSSLSHPHILTVYAVGDYGSDQYLVTELVEDGTLQDWIRSRSPSWRQVVDLLAGVADGLAAAHAAGMLHRDIKPANILVARSGHAKLADFGLAKPIDSGDAATRVESLQTHTGLIVGTLAYMSPEQAAGKTLDARSDIFSFGIVLYEACVRRHPYAGASGPELLHAIIHRPPEPLLTDLPIALRLVIEKALANNPDERYQSMRELVVDLRRVLRYPTEPLIQAQPVRGRSPLSIGAGVAFGAVIGALAVGWLLRPQPTAMPNPLEGALFTRFTSFEGTERSAAISSDGRFVAFRADRNGPLDVWLGQVGTGRFANLTKGIDDEFSTDTPSCGFSGDGSEVWLSGGPDRRLRLMPMLGGAPRPFLADRAVTSPGRRRRARRVSPAG